MEDELELSKLKGDKKIPLRILIKRTLHYMKGETFVFILAFILLILNVALTLVLPLFIEEVTDTVAKPNFELKHVIIVSVWYLIVSIINMVFLYFESMLLQKAGQKIIYNLRMDVFDHIEKMSQNQFDEMPVGSLVTRVASYTQSMSDLFTKVLVNVLKNILLIIGVYVMILYLSWKLSLIMLIPVSIVFVTSFIFAKISSNLFRKERHTLSDMNTFLNENLSGMRITQVFNQQKTKEEEFNFKNNQLRKIRFRIILAFGIYRPFVTLVYITSVALGFYLGFKYGLTAGAIVAFYMYLSKFFNPIQELADQLNSLEKAFTASERLFNLLDVEPEVRDSDDAIDIDHFEGKIEFKNVWFYYKKDEWILKDVSFVIEPKQTCAFVGATGAGKTTILGLIVRNYEIQKGEILIDGININKIKLKSLRRCIGQMLQDVFLFSGTIKDNITLNDESYSDERVLEICNYVNANRILERTNEGLNFEIIDRGENLSQGERQLISFARTVLAEPQVLILDEATANIDTETEVLIQESLEKIKNIGTMLVVAHRLSTIQHADQIIVLQNGEIIERGNHQELLKNHGHYYKLYKLQFENK